MGWGFPFSIDAHHRSVMILQCNSLEDDYSAFSDGFWLAFL